MRKDVIEALYERNSERFLNEWKELVSMASVSSLPDYSGDCFKCALWLEEHMKNIGMSARILEVDDGAPVVFGETRGQPDKPVVLIYGHYDVQPPGPLSLWETDPFKPEIRNGRLYGRGARDNKGQFFFWLKVIEILIQEDLLDCNVKVFLDGQEESGSISTMEHLHEWNQELDCDVLLACETRGCDDGHPALAMGLRGAAWMRVTVEGPNREVHSGNFGGIVKNPVNELVRLTSTMFNEDGSVAVEGFYDGFVPPTDAEREAIKTYPFDETFVAQEFDLDGLSGDPEYLPAERIGFFPTVEMSDIYSGYSGLGIRTIIPSFARVVISIRTARGQDPAKCLQALEDHIRSNIDPAVRLTIEDKDVLCKALSGDLASPLVQRSNSIINELFGKPAPLFWMGATLPVISKVVDKQGSDFLLVGFGQVQDAEHGPNESFGLEQFKKGFMFGCGLLSDLSR